MSYAVQTLDEKKLMKEIIFFIIAAIIVLLNFLTPDIKHVDHNIHVNPEDVMSGTNYTVR